MRRDCTCFCKLGADEEVEFWSTGGYQVDFGMTVSSVTSDPGEVRQIWALPGWSSWQSVRVWGDAL